MVIRQKITRFNFINDINFNLNRFKVCVTVGKGTKDDIIFNLKSLFIRIKLTSSIMIIRKLIFYILM